MGWFIRYKSLCKWDKCERSNDGIRILWTIITKYFRASLFCYDYFHIIIVELGREELLKGLREENENMGKGEGICCRTTPAVSAIINMDLGDCNSK